MAEAETTAASSKKRGAGDDGAGGEGRGKKAKTWQKTQARAKTSQKTAQIESDDAGIWVTCDKGKEGRAVGEARDVFAAYAEQIYQITDGPAQSQNGKAAAETPDIEASIADELNALHDHHKNPEQHLFEHVRLDMPCVLFFKVRPPIDPVALVHAICQDAMTPAPTKRSRHLKRLTPATSMAKASESGLRQLAESVLKKHFHQEEGQVSRKFAIRPTIRHHNTLNRDQVIKLVAQVVGPNHSVSLTEYDALILVDVYKNMCGMAVVSEAYDKLKRFNLAELYRPAHGSDSRPKEA